MKLKEAAMILLFRSKTRRVVMADRDQKGFTFIELVFIIVIIGILTAVAIPKFGTLIDNAYRSGALKEMHAIKRAVIGDAKSNTYGYYQTVGDWPSDVNSLLERPASVPTFNKFTQIGWNGPYLTSINRDSDSSSKDALLDPWGNNYSISSLGTPAKRCVHSFGPDGADNSGGGDDVTVFFE